MNNYAKYKGKMRREYLHVTWAACVMFDCCNEDLAYLIGVQTRTFEVWLVKYPELAYYVDRGRKRYITDHPEEYPEHPITKAMRVRDQEFAERNDIY